MTLRFISILLAILLVSSCAPMPGNDLLTGLSQPTSLETVRITKTVGLWETTSFCNRGMEPHVVALNCLLNACVVMGCADVKWNEEGHIESCDIYVAYDWDWIVDHEMRHCMGYADVFY